MSQIVSVMGPIDARQIVKVYSGRQGCACGCRGKYTYTGLTNESRGETVNLKVVRQIVKKVSLLGAKAYADAPHFFNESLVFADSDFSDRTYTIYFKEV